MADEQDAPKKRGVMSGIIGALWNSGEGSAPGGETPQQVAIRMTPSIPGEATPEALEKLRDAVGMNDQGPIASFLAVAETLKNALPDDKALDEKDLYAAALKVLSRTQLITAEMILDEYRQRIEQLHAEASRSKELIEELTAKKVHTIQQALAVVREEIARKRTELAEMEALAVRREADIASEHDAILAIDRNFTAAHDAVMAELQGGETKFRTLLGIT